MIKRIYKGMFHSEKYGSHPGNFWLLWFMFLGAIMAGWLGIAVMSIVIGPDYLLGCYERGDY